MNNNNAKIRNLLDEAVEILERISITYQSPVGPNTRALLRTVQFLMPLIEKDYPMLNDIMRHAVLHITFPNKCINAYSFGDLRTSIEVLNMLYPPITKKVFISYSSQDEVLVRKFITEILLAGCNLRQDEIFCTIKHSDIKTGEDFRDEIVRNMKECDFILLMISNNYKQSEVCLNEMGAAWALTGKSILPFVLPGCKFDDMGFIYKVKQGASIIDTEKLDELYEDMYKSYGFAPHWADFNRIKENFVKSIPSLIQP